MRSIEPHLMFLILILNNQQSKFLKFKNIQTKVVGFTDQNLENWSN
jgi:hypothetical protein